MSTLLKKYREDLGKDISEVAAITRIKESALRAIEEEDYDKLPVEVYARGYIREYAKYLGVAAENALAPYEKYLEVKNKKERKVAPAEAETPVTPAKEEKPAPEISRPVEQPVAEARREKEKSDKTKVIWTVLLLVIVGLAIVYQFISSKNAERETSQVAPLTQAPQPPQPQPAQPQPVTPPAETQPALPAQPIQPVPETQAKAPESKPAETKTPAASAKKKHVLQIVATDTAWVQVTMDGTQTREALMKPGDVASYEANSNVSFVVGNAGGVTIKFDGKELPAGKKGEVLRLSLPAGSKPQPAKPKEPQKTIKKAPAENDSDFDEDFNENTPASKKPAGAPKP